MPSKFCATAREARDSCSIESRGERAPPPPLPPGGHCREGERSRGKKERRKAREALLSVVVLYHFSKSFYLVLFPPPSFLFLLFVTSSFPPFHHLSLPLPFCLLRHEEHRICRGRGIRFHVYTQDGSDWPGLKPSQITP